MNNNRYSHLVKPFIWILSISVISSFLLILLEKYTGPIYSDVALQIIENTLFWMPITLFVLFFFSCVENRVAIGAIIGGILFVGYLVIARLCSFLQDTDVFNIVQVIGLISGACLGFFLFRVWHKKKYDTSFVQAVILTFLGLSIFSLCASNPDNLGALAIAGTSLLISAISLLTSSTTTQRHLQIVRRQQFENHYYECRRSIQNIVDENEVIYQDALKSKNKGSCRIITRAKVEKKLLHPIAQQLLLLHSFGSEDESSRSSIFEKEEKKNEFASLSSDEESFYQKFFVTSMDEDFVEVVNFFLNDAVSLQESEIKVIRAYFKQD